MGAIEKRARELLAMTLGERGFHCEAENVRTGEDLESYEGELQAIAQLLRWGFNNVQEHKQAALTPPEGYVLIKADTLADLANDAEALIVQTEFRRDRIDGKLASVREARAMLAARPEVP